MRFPEVLLPIGVALTGLVFVADFQAWIMLTIAGLGMGMILFMASSGLTLVFGLMGVVNFGHGIFLTLGAFAGALILHPRFFLVFYQWFWADNIVVNVLGLFFAGLFSLLATCYASEHMALNLLAILFAVVVVMLIGLPFGWIFERVLIRPAGKDTARQIMLTAAGAVVITELCIVLLGLGARVRPSAAFSGSWIVGDVAIEKMRVLMIVLGLAIWGGLVLLLNRTRLGILIRATVENRELVEVLGYRTRALMTGVFLLGVGLAVLGGLIWGMYQQGVGVYLGNGLLPLLFMILMIGGLGSISGTLMASLMVGLLTNYVGYSYPALVAFSSILLMMAVVLWRPQGLVALRRI